MIVSGFFMNRFLIRRARDMGLNLRFEFVHRVGARARDRLISGGKVTLQTKPEMQRPERHQRDGRRAIGIGNNFVRGCQNISIDFRYNKWF